VIFCVCLGVQRLAAGPAPDSPVNNLIATNHYLNAHWDAGQGLLTNDLRSVIQTQDGYIWIGSSAGLVRFDGVRFTIFNSHNTHEMASDEVTSLSEDSAGTLWVSLRRGGILSVARGRFSVPACAESLRKAECYGLFFDDEGALCVCTTQGLFRTLGDRAQWVRGLPEAVQGGRRAAGRGYYVAGGGLYYCQGWEARRKLAEQQKGEGYTSLCQEADGSILAGTSSGLERIRVSDGGAVSRTEIAILRQPLSIVPFGPGRFLVGSLERGIQVLDHDGLTTLPGFEVLRGGGRQVRCITIDREGGIWATTPGGLYRFRKSFIRILGADVGIATEFSWTVRLTRDGTLWVGGGDRGTYRISRDGVRLFGKKDGMPSGYVSAIYEAADGSVWFGGMTDGLAVYRNGVLRRLSGYPDRGVYSLSGDGKGGLLIGGATGLHQFDGARFSPEPVGGPAAGLSKIRAMVPTSEGLVWVVASGRLYRYGNGALTMFEARVDRLVHQIMCIYVDSGRVWAGTYGGGLYMLQSDSLLPVRPQGYQPGPRILAVHEDAAGYLWINAERELQRVPKSDLLKAVVDTTATVRVWTYDHQEGLSNLDFSYVSSSSAQQLPGGQILYSSTNGIVVVNTKGEPVVHHSPPVFVEEIVADGVTYNVHDGPELPPGTRRVEIRFTALQFDAPRRVQFRVRTTDLDRDWVALDGLTRSVVYTIPPPGRYLFQVSASSASDSGNASEASAAFVVAPYLYQTWWFRWGSGLLIAGLLIGGYRARMRTMRKRHAAMSLEIAHRRTAEDQLRASLDEKTVLLKEIHHRVKNNLQVISSLLNLQAGMHRDEQLRRELQESQQRIRTMALIHERLYRSENLARIGFREYVETLVNQLSRSMGREEVICRVEGVDVMLSVGQAIPSALIVNELVTNALKHAFPAGRRGEIVVSIADPGEGMTEFSVRDNGCGLPGGFDPRKVETLGLQLVATLTTQLEGELTVEEGSGTGFCVRFRRD